MSKFRNIPALGLCAMAMFCMDMTGTGIRISFGRRCDCGPSCDPGQLRRRGKAHHLSRG